MSSPAHSAALDKHLCLTGLLSPLLPQAAVYLSTQVGETVRCDAPCTELPPSWFAHGPRSLSSEWRPDKGRCDEVIYRPSSPLHHSSFILSARKSSFWSCRTKSTPHIGKCCKICTTQV